MQYILTQDELDRLETEKVTKILVEFIELISPVTSLPRHAPEEERDRRIEKSVRDMCDLAKRYGADFARVVEIYEEEARKLKTP